MRYHAKTEDGRLVGEGRTLGTAVKWAKKRGGDYVVDDLTGVVQWRPSGAAKPSPLPLPWTQGAAGEIWFDGEVVAVSSAPDLSDVGCKIRGERAARIVRAVNSHAGLVAALTALANVTGEKGMDKTVLSSLVAEAWTALRAAGEL